MNTIQFELGGGASIALPTDIVVKQLIEQLQTEAKATSISTYPPDAKCW